VPHAGHREDKETHVKYVMLIIDTPAAPEQDAAEAAKVADLCLAVARPTYLDLAAAVRSVAPM